MELNVIVTVHNMRVLFTTLFSIKCIFRLFPGFREGVKKERTGKFCNWSNDMLLHVHDNDRNTGGGGWEGRREAENETGL